MESSCSDLQAYQMDPLGHPDKSLQANFQPTWRLTRCLWETWLPQVANWPCSTSCSWVTGYDTSNAFMANIVNQARPQRRWQESAQAEQFGNGSKKCTSFLRTNGQTNLPNCVPIANNVYIVKCHSTLTKTNPSLDGSNVNGIKTKSNKKANRWPWRTNASQCSKILVLFGILIVPHGSNGNMNCKSSIANVSGNYAENPQLATSVKCQRRENKLFCDQKASKITLARINKLTSLCFEWLTAKSASRNRKTNIKLVAS